MLRNTARHELTNVTDHSIMQEMGGAFRTARAPAAMQSSLAERKRGQIVLLSVAGKSKASKPTLCGAVMLVHGAHRDCCSATRL